jgi:hypothetical protein
MTDTAAQRCDSKGRDTEFLPSSDVVVGVTQRRGTQLQSAKAWITQEALSRGPM